MGKPIDPWDSIEKSSVVRREVFKIHPIYRQEYEAAFQDYMQGLPSDAAARPQAELRESFIFSPQAGALCRRWGLKLALHPDDDLWDTAPISAPQVENFQAEIHRWPKFEAGPKTIVSPIPFELLEDLWKLRKSRGDNSGKKPGRGPSLDIYLDEEPASGPVTIFQVWNMNKKEGKSPWKIAQELNPDLKTLTVKRCTRKKCPEKLDFQTLTNKKKETYNNKFCGKKDSCLIAKALLKNVRDAIAKAESLITSVSPIE
ncbi:MAG: hypothetical protein NTY36_00860 [Deltaproteobacteria bacterium]|nr:hypothetical protein [Deltaproteobacteria bacterium]